MNVAVTSQIPLMRVGKPSKSDVPTEINLALAPCKSEAHNAATETMAGKDEMKGFPSCVHGASCILSLVRARGYKCLWFPCTLFSHVFFFPLLYLDILSFSSPVLFGYAHEDKRLERFLIHTR